MVAWCEVDGRGPPGAGGAGANGTTLYFSDDQGLHNMYWFPFRRMRKGGARVKFWREMKETFRRERRSSLEKICYRTALLGCIII